MLAEDLSRDVAPEKFRSKAKSVGGFVFGQLGDVFFGRHTGGYTHPQVGCQIRKFNEAPIFLREET